MGVSYLAVVARLGVVLAVARLVVPIITILFILLQWSEVYTQ
jgi:hypothetical protein